MTILHGFLTSIEKFTAGIISGICAFFAPLEVTLLAIGFFIAIDAVLAYRVARSIGQTKFQSKKLWRTINKFGEAMLLVIGAHIIDTTIITSINLHLVEIVSGIICGTEFISWLESLTALRPNSLLLRVIRKLFGNIIMNKSEKYLGKQMELDELIKDTDAQIKVLKRKSRKLKQNKENVNLNALEE